MTENIDHQEVNKFAELADEWWNKNGDFKPLHVINPLRANYIKEKLDLESKSILDVGCGGGILSEKLKRLGAKINIKGNKAIIEGTNNLEGAELMSSDLRASVALVLAAFVSRGTSIINRVYHLDRGYEKIENKLKKIGVKIKRIS